MGIWDGPPLRVFKYIGWCAICRLCRHAVATGSKSQEQALKIALTHSLSDAHLKRVS